MRKIEDIHEVHTILLGIAKEFHRVCEKEHIPYYMLAGTMLGAVRHKGFIPWDDDMDFGVPRKDFARLIQALERELSDEYRCLTYQNSKQIFYPFIKIEDNRTCIDDPRLNCALEEKPGVNIDIFPLDRCNQDSFRMNCIFLLIKIQTMLFVESTSNSVLKRFIKHFLCFFTPFNKNFLIQIIDKSISSVKQGEFVINFLGGYKYRDLFNASIYESTKEYEFEWMLFKGVENSNIYLSQIYGDYMQIPPEKQRMAHVDCIYMKD